jgi:hypothetical protein
MASNDVDRVKGGSREGMIDGLGEGEFDRKAD